jgi:glycosyltransferase involved in cell wall biosynthesis
MGPGSATNRVLFIDHTASLGGGEIALLNLVTNLDRRRYEPVVLLCSDGPLLTRMIDGGIETHLLPLSGDVVNARKDSLGVATLLRLPGVFSAIRYIWRLRRFIRDQHVDIVHTNSLKADLLGGVAARLARVPLIWHIRDRIDRDYLPWIVVHVFRRLCRVVPDFVIANSQATLDTLCLNRTERTAAIPSGINPRARANDESGRQDQRVRRVGLVGRISRWKGQHIFLQAAARIHAQFPEVRFQIIGAALFSERAYEQEIRALSSALGLDECVEFTGFREDVPALLDDLEILVHASVTAEPFGQVLTEGMAAGKPVVATAGGGALEIVLDGVTGLLVPMGDAEAMANAVAQLLTDPPAARRLGEAGQLRVRAHFAIEHTVAKVERVYDQILQSRQSAAPRGVPSQPVAVG